MASSSSSSSTDAIALLERAAASADSSAILTAAARFQSQLHSAAFDNDVITSRLWEAVVSSIANHQLPESSVSTLRDLSVGLAAAKPPSLVAVGGICSARLSGAGGDTGSLTSALKAITVLGSIPAIQLQLRNSSLPLLLLRLHQRHSIAAAAPLAADPSISFKHATRSHPVPPLPSSSLRISYSSAAAAGC